MRRAERLFDIIQHLRGSRRPLSAAMLAERLEVSPRTIYRDVASLQGSGVPIAGEAGVGYVLRAGYDLPPLMFTPEETQTIAVALDLLRRTGDRGLQDAARQVRTKIAAVLPARPAAASGSPFYVSGHGAVVPDVVCLSEVRLAIRAARKLRIGYLDRDGTATSRTIWPLAVAYFTEATLIGAWCELRGDYRHFRADRVCELALLEDVYPAGTPGLLDGWWRLQAGYT